MGNIKWSWVCHTCGRSGDCLRERGERFTAMHAGIEHLLSLAAGGDCPQCDMEITSLEVVDASEG